ncbi:MAG: hypothetical protein AAFX94_06005 [Myxococcota bacterium]
MSIFYRSSQITPKPRIGTFAIPIALTLASTLGCGEDASEGSETVIQRPDAAGDLGAFTPGGEFADRGNGVFCPTTTIGDIAFHITTSEFACVTSPPASSTSLPGQSQQAQAVETPLYVFDPSSWTAEEIDALTEPLDDVALAEWIWERSSEPGAERDDFASDLDEAVSLIFFIANGRGIDRFFTSACENLTPDERTRVSSSGLRYFQSYYAKEGVFDPTNWAGLANSASPERTWPDGLIDGNQELRRFAFDEARTIATELIAKYDAVDEGEEFGMERRRPSWDSGSVYGDGQLTIDQMTNVVASELEAAYTAREEALPPCYLETVREFAWRTVAQADGDRLDVGASEVVDYFKCSLLGVKGADTCRDALVSIGDVIKLEQTPVLNVIRYDSADETVAQTPATVEATETIGCSTDGDTQCAALIMRFDLSEVEGSRLRSAAVSMTVPSAGTPVESDEQLLRRFARPLPESVTWDDVIGAQYADDQQWFWNSLDPGCVQVEEEQCYFSRELQGYPDGTETVFGFSLSETAEVWLDTETGRPNYGVMLSDTQLPRLDSNAAYTVDTSSILMTLYYDVF